MTGQEQENQTQHVQQDTQQQASMDNNNQAGGAVENAAGNLAGNPAENTTENAAGDKQAQVKRLVGIAVIGVLSLIVFFYLASGVTDLLMADAQM